MEGHRRIGSLVWPLVLVGLGVVLLLNNLGMLDWSVWEMILRLWPVVIIGFGLELLIGRRSIWGSLLAALLVVAILAGAVYLSRSPVTGTRATTETISQALDGAERGEVTIDFGVGRLTVDAGAAEGVLVDGRATLARGQRLISEGRVAGGVAYYRIGSEESGAGWLGGTGGQREWTLHLNPSIPLTLLLRSGVGETRLDLSGLQVTDLEIQSGVGQVVVVLPGRGRVRVSVDSGVGELVLRVPRNLAVRMEVDSGLGHVSVPSDFDREDGVYLSPGFDTARDRADIQVDGGIGRIVVEWQP